jgi:hypothetical protein
MQTSERERGQGQTRDGRGRRGAVVRALRVGLSSLVCVVLGGVAASCSLIVNTSADQCKIDSDCASFPNGAHTCVMGLCTGGSETECQHSADCTSKGQFFACRKQKCVSLMSDNCTTVYSTKKNQADAYLDDTAVFFGSIMPTNSALGDADYGKLVEDSIKLALDDFGKVNGIPALMGGGNRPLVLIGCNDGPNEDETDVAAKYLIDKIGVPAIIGYAFSGNTITVAGDVTIPDGVLLFSPSATSNDITSLPDQDLVWRTAPRDDFQATALSLYYPDVEASAKKKYPMIGTDPTSNPMKVAIVHHSDAYGAGLADALQKILVFNGKPAADPFNANNYKNIDYGSAGTPSLTKVADVVAFAPDVIFLFGFNEGVDTVFPAIESSWVVPSDMHRPYFVFSDGGEVGSLWGKDITTEDQRVRISGSVPGVNAQSWAPYNNFLLHYNGSPYSSDGTADTIGPSGAYDILYMLAYSTVMVGSNPLTGSNLVKLGLRKMVASTMGNVPLVQIDPSTIAATLPMLAGDTPINIQGTSGPLDFDDKGDVKADIQIWCVPKGTAPAVGGAAIPSGRFYDSTASKIAGSIGAACGLP